MNYPYEYAAFSQLEAGSGRDNCGQACLACRGIAAHKLDPKQGQHALLDLMSEATRGTPDNPSNPLTTLYQMDRGLRYLGEPDDWSNAYAAALAAPWSICLVDGVRITMADRSKPYPASWFGGLSGPDHFIVWGPQFNGASNWFMNPLDESGPCWAQYDLDSIRAAWGGAYLLPALATDPKPVHPTTWTALRSFGLLIQPRHQHDVMALTVVPKGATGHDYGERHTDAQGTVWARLGYGAHGVFYVGWAPASYLKE